MEPQQNSIQNQELPIKESWYAPLNRVTLISKILAAIVFITLPFLGFLLGVVYSREVVVESAVTEPVITHAAKETDAPSTTSAEMIPQSVDGVLMLPDDATTNTVDVGEYQIRYKKESPTVVQILYGASNPKHIQNLEWNFPSAVGFSTQNKNINIFITDKDFNFDGHNDLGLMTWVYRGYSRYDLFTYNPTTHMFAPLLIGGGGGVSAPKFDPVAKTLTTTMPSPDPEDGDNSLLSTIVYQFKNGEYIKK